MLHISHRAVFKKIVAKLRALGYAVWFRPLRTQDHGIPHSRTRLYMVAIRKDSIRKAFTFPTAIPRKRKAKAMMIRDPAIDKRNRLPDHPRERILCKKAYNQALDKGVDPRRSLVIVDIRCSDKYASYGVNSMPCMTATRSSQRGWWCSVVGRQISLLELWQFQGVELEAARQIMQALEEHARETKRKVVSQAQIGHMLGNTMSLNVIERLLAKALPAAGLVAGRIVDPWVQGAE